MSLLKEFQAFCAWDSARRILSDHLAEKPEVALVIAELTEKIDELIDKWAMMAESEEDH